MPRTIHRKLPLPPIGEIRYRFHIDRQLWQSSSFGQPWYDLPRVPLGASEDFVRGYIAGRVGSMDPAHIVPVPYLDTWTECCFGYGDMPHSGARQYTPAGGG